MKPTTHTHSLQIMENRYFSFWLIFFYPIFRSDPVHSRSTAEKKKKKIQANENDSIWETDVYIYEKCQQTKEKKNWFLMWIVSKATEQHQTDAKKIDKEQVGNFCLLLRRKHQ